MAEDDPVADYLSSHRTGYQTSTNNSGVGFV